MTGSATSGLLSAAKVPRMSLTLMRATATRRMHFHDVKQPRRYSRLFVPATRCARGLRLFFCSSTPTRGVGGAPKGDWGVEPVPCPTRWRLRGAGRTFRLKDARLSALHPWLFWLRGRTPAKGRVPGTSRGFGYESPPRDATPRSVSDVSRKRPSEQDATLIY